MRKNKIRLTESQLHKLVKKSVKSFINEGGNLTWKDDDGRMHTNSKDNWYGIEGATFVWHGEWSDAEIYFDYNGEQYVINATDAEDCLWYLFKEYCEENNLNPDEHSDDEIWYNFAKNEGYNVLLDLGPYNESYTMNESKYMNKNSDTYSRPKQRVKVSESQLRQIIKESAEQIMNEAYSDAQYAHLAGQAHGALNSFGGKLKGMFNPNWKRRKNRQMNKFAKQATHQNFGYEKSSTNGGDYNNGGAYYNMPNDNWTYSNGGQADYLKNRFNQENHKSPFEVKRSQWYETVDDPGNSFSKREHRAMDNDGRVYSGDETLNIAKQHADKNEWKKYDDIRDVRDANSMLNREFKRGQQARKGKPTKTLGGTYTTGTGTSSDYFKRLK